MRHCEKCGFLGMSGYEYPESYCTVGIQDDDPKFDEDKDGCGCRYNIRTLRKMQKENDHAEYLCYLGYDDYMLMPTMEHTEENENILERHRKLIRHALGMDNRKSYVRHGKRFYRPYRNYFYTTEKTVDFPYWERIAKPFTSIGCLQSFRFSNIAIAVPVPIVISFIYFRIRSHQPLCHMASYIHTDRI